MEGADVAAVVAALRAPGEDRALDQYLARRAVDALPVDTLRTLSADPGTTWGPGEFSVLADAELRRLGLRRP